MLVVAVLGSLGVTLGDAIISMGFLISVEMIAEIRMLYLQRSLAVAK